MWSRNYAHCLRCKSTKFKHVSNGLCNSCYLYSYRNNEANKETARKTKHDWYVRNVQGTDKLKIARDKKLFSGNREKVLIRDNHKCTRCGSGNKLIVHHKDGNGRNNPNPNNEMSNLITLCMSCHIEEHREELHKAKGIVPGMWSIKYDECVRCKTTVRKHSSNGYCRTCVYHYKKSKSTRYSPNLQATVRDEQK